MENKNIFGGNLKIKSQSIFFTFILITSIFLFGSGSNAYSQDKKTSSYKSEDGKTILMFDEEENGKLSHWKAVFDEDGLTALYKDGKKIPSDKLDYYEDMVYNKINDMYPNRKRMAFHFKGFPFDKEEFKEYFKNHKEEWKFDSEEFKQNMEELKEKLKELKIHPPKIDFDTAEFRENLRKMTEQLKHQRWATRQFNIHVPDIDIHIPDIPDISIPEIDIDIPEINVEVPEIDLSELHENMNNLDLDMKELDRELKKLDEFIKDLKNEMVNDGLLKSIDDEAKIDISGTEMRVNEIKVPDNLLEKYKKMYKEHFDKDLEPDSHFKIR
jgi:hypothetical protein